MPSNAAILTLKITQRAWDHGKNRGLTETFLRRIARYTRKSLQQKT